VTGQSLDFDLVSGVDIVCENDVLNGERMNKLAENEMRNENAHKVLDEISQSSR
ncbi:hypothetical protein U1Q18_039500, partial [Sarracenia purpurea var. burkii]